MSELKEIAFVAALYHSGAVFSVDAEGQAKLVLQVPADQMRPLAEAMALGQLTERTFTVRLELG